MIQLTSPSGRAHYISPAAYVRLFDGRTLEVRETAADVAQAIAAHTAKEGETP